jgi:regulator of protease activity HflC (stomatin/prohibitin superfamily)
LPGKISSYIGSHDIDELLREDPEPGKTIRAYVEQRLKTELNKELAKNGITVLDLKIDKNKKIEVDPIVEKVLTEHWAAEKESLLIIEEGRAKAGELRYRLEKELAATEAFEEAISEGLESINPEHFSQLLSLMSRELATNIVDPIARAQLTQTILKEYNKIRDENTLL